MTVPQVSRELGVTGGAIHIAITLGRLPCVVRYGRKLIARTELDAYRQRTQPDGVKKVGRPRKEQEARSE